MKRISGHFLTVVSGMILMLNVACLSTVVAQTNSITFSSSDTALENSFNRAKQMALSHRGNPTDPIGPWYEASLPSRNAFCVRDVSHQVIAAGVLGMESENKNMLTHFISNISEGKDWCTFWEMNKCNKPAPEDYRNDKEFWYNLNANFELIYTCWRLYLWTGDSSYVFNPTFRKFFDITVEKYIQRWALQPDSLLHRAAYMNTSQPFNPDDNFQSCRGLPSYYESVHGIRMGVDLIAAIYRGLESYASMAERWGDKSKQAHYSDKAETYRLILDKSWWDNDKHRYQTYLDNSGKLEHGEGETFLLWYDALADTNRIRHTIDRLISASLNVENLSYFPYQLCRYGYGEEAYKEILYLTNPTTDRREYPEVSFGVVDGIVQGVMGVNIDARTNSITTLYNLSSIKFCEVQNLKVLSSYVDLKHWNKGSTLVNNGKITINWRAAFRQKIDFIKIADKKIKSHWLTDRMGNRVYYAEVKVLPGQSVTATIP